MSEMIPITESKVQATRLEAERVVNALPGGPPEVYDVVRKTEQELLDALSAHRRDLDRVEIRWTCTVIGTTPTEKAKIDLHPGAPAGTRTLPTR